MPAHLVYPAKCARGENQRRGITWATVNSQQMHSVYFASEPFQKAPFCWWAPQRGLSPVPASYAVADARCWQPCRGSAAAVVPPAPITPRQGAADQQGPYLGLSWHPGAISKRSRVSQVPLGSLLSPSVAGPVLTEHPADAGEPGGPPPSPRGTIMGLYSPPPRHILQALPGFYFTLWCQPLIPATRYLHWHVE